ncbi:MULTISPECIES: ABC transporter ATP-binding protein [Streptomyces]|uniref:ABC transporter ATP-binding protein n=1 Tax=Streptomyces globisporus C-1027 TaxID=1172567 RepID=A0A0U3MPR7_STRGL|nr:MULTISPECIES: ATP-binding cassette domain-containing protein [Streptomyces]ALU98319.1 ABC transporter ATP-binding protein [Streptomyces globisporus C-1027]OKJ25765.1 branched-chain amino acid ABC transporter ATP-binding protein [Streptomyces sp. CB02130]
MTPTPAPTTPPPPVLALDRLTRRYGTLTAVDDVSLRLPAGARHAVIGPNGAGKTTLLNLIAGTDRPDHGTIALDGADVTRKPTAKRSRLGIARSFQQPSVIAELSVLDNVVLAGWPHHPRRRGAWRRPSRHRLHKESAGRHLETVGLADLAQRPAATLSHGQRRMLDLAAALAGDPRLLLLDEPAAGLTDGDIGRLLGIIGALPSSVAVVLVEHHVEVVAELATSVTVLAAGKVLVDGPTQEVLAHPEVREAYHGTAPSTGQDDARAEAIPTVCPSPTDARG